MVPKKFFRRKDKFLAVQWSESRYEEIRELTRGRVYYDSATKQYYVFSHGVDVPLRDGDYIVENRGEYDMWSEDVFDTLFEIIPGQDDE